MAIWQYSFYLVPKESFSKLEITVDKEGLFDDSIFWRREPTTIDTFNKLELILPRGKTWDSNLVIYGEEESTCIGIFHENKVITSAYFRVDFASNYELILPEILESFLLKSILLLNEDLNVVSYNLYEIKSLVEHSAQYHKYNDLSKE